MLFFFYNSNSKKHVERQLGDGKLKKKLTILFTSDIHGAVYPHNYGNNQAAHLGLGKVATIIKREREKNQHTVVIDNGDLIQGTPLTYHYVHKMKNKKNPMIKILNKLQYDAAIIGNHEFNYGREILQQSIEQSNFPWLSANIVDEHTLKPFCGKPYLMKVVNGIKIAILGLTTHFIPNWEDPSHIEGLKFMDALEAAKEWVTKIKQNEHPDVIIVSYHGGMERDIESGEPTESLTGENQGYAICEQVDGIDVLLTGHQHRMLTGTINGVEIIQPSNNGRYVGKVTVEVNEEGKRIEKKSQLLSVEEVNADKEILDLVSADEKATQEWLDQPIGVIDRDMLIEDPMAIRLQDSPLMEFINTVQMASAGVKISTASLFTNEIGGFKSRVTMRDIVTNYIYPNTFKVLALTGKDIRSALEKSATYFSVNEKGEPIVNPKFLYPKPQHYNYDMWEGIEYVLDITKPIGQRVVTLKYDGENIEGEALFEVVMNNYRAGGGGDYWMFKGKKIVREIQYDASELIANYIGERSVVKAKCNENWKVIW